MRKNRLKGSLLLILALLTVRCTSDLPQPDVPISQSQVVSIDEVPGLLEAIAPYVNPSWNDRGDINSANQSNTYFGMSIDLEYIKSRIDSSNFTNYSFLVDDGIDDPRVIKNLVIGQDAEGQWKTPMLMTYTMTDEFFEQYASTGALEGFTGTIRKEQLRPLSYQSQQNGRQPMDSEEEPDDYGSDRDQPDTTCPEETAVSGGGGATGSTSYTETCEVFLVTVYSTDGHGNRYIHDQYLSYENCEVEADQFSSAGSENCENPTGEVPINEELEEEPDCESFIFTRDFVEAHWQQAVVRGIYFYVVLIDPNTGVRGYTRIQFDQPIAFGAPTLFHTGETLTPGDAAWASAGNLSEAMRESARRFDGTEASALDVRNFFTEKLKQFFREAGGRATFNYSGTQKSTLYRARTGTIGDCRDN